MHYIELSDIIFRIVLAILIGGFIGYEREMKNRPAGFITHTLVCVGACVVSLMQIQMIYETIYIIENNPILAPSMKADLGRVVAQVISGVGFLGAGTIIFDKGSVKGLTTATTIWVVACIGLVIGLGYYRIALSAGVGIGFITICLKKLGNKAKDHKFQMVLEIKYNADEHNFIEECIKIFKKNKVKIRDITLINQMDNKIKCCRFVVYFGILNNRENLIEKLTSNNSIISLIRK